MCVQIRQVNSVSHKWLLEGSALRSPAKDATMRPRGVTVVTRAAPLTTVKLRKILIASKGEGEAPAEPRGINYLPRGGSPGASPSQIFSQLLSNYGQVSQSLAKNRVLLQRARTGIPIKGQMTHTNKPSTASSRRLASEPATKNSPEVNCPLP